MKTPVLDRLSGYTRVPMITVFADFPIEDIEMKQLDSVYEYVQPRESPQEVLIV